MQAITHMVQAAADQGWPVDADQLLAMINEPQWKAHILTVLVDALDVDDAGRDPTLHQAEVDARRILDPDLRAVALGRIATGAATDRARWLTAEALQSGHWRASLTTLTRIEPAAVAAIADELLTIDDHHS